MSVLIHLTLNLCAIPWGRGEQKESVLFFSFRLLLILSQYMIRGFIIISACGFNQLLLTRDDSSAYSFPALLSS